MSNEILYILLPDFAEHEMVYLAEAIASDEFSLKENPKYINKFVASTLDPIKSIGGFRIMPDYSFDTIPDDYAALVLIGGFGWVTPIADKVVPIVRQAVENGKIVGAICNAASSCPYPSRTLSVPFSQNPIRPQPGNDVPENPEPKKQRYINGC